MKKKNTEVSWDWCQYMDDEKDGLFTVRRSVKTDYAKFHSQLEAQAFIREREKDPTHD